MNKSWMYVTQNAVRLIMQVLPPLFTDWHIPGLLCGCHCYPNDLLHFNWHRGLEALPV